MRGVHLISKATNRPPRHLLGLGCPSVQWLGGNSASPTPRYRRRKKKIRVKKLLLEAESLARNPPYFTTPFPRTLPFSTFRSTSILPSQSTRNSFSYTMADEVYDGAVGIDLGKHKPGLTALGRASSPPPFPHPAPLRSRTSLTDAFS